MPLNFLRQFFSKSSTIDTNEEHGQPIQEIVENDRFKPWQHLHHGLRLTVNVLKPFAISRMILLYETAPNMLETRKGRKPSNEELLEFLCTFDKFSR